jgi:hypothetical protein
MSIPIRSFKFWIHVFIPGDIYKIYTRIVPAGFYLSKMLRGSVLILLDQAVFAHANS